MTRRAIWAKRRVGADADRAHDEPAAGVDRGAEHLVAGLHLHRHALAGEERLVDRRAPLLDDAVGGDLLARSDDEEVACPQVSDRDPLLAPLRVEPAHVLRAQLQQRPQRSARAALRPYLEIAAGEDERGDDGCHLEIDLPRGLVAVDQKVEAHSHGRLARVQEEERDDGPTPRGERPGRDQCVHRGRRVLEVEPGRAVERPGAPEHDRRRQLEREPLPVVELERLDHREQEHRQRERRREDQPAPPRRGRIFGVLLRGRLFRPGERRRVAGSLHHCDEVLRRDERWIEGHGRVLGRVVDGRLDALELVEALLDPHRAGRARHPLDRQLEPLGQRRAHDTARVRRTVSTRPPTWNWR